MQISHMHLHINTGLQVYKQAASLNTSKYAAVRFRSIAQIIIFVYNATLD